jgi:acyl-coenzyme A synthetase/AMP-(fatty) acid ligase/acyl carrier protein
VAEQGLTPSRLKTFIVGGENLDAALARRVHEQFGGRVAIFNEYGPTETTVGCMIHRFDPERDRRASVPIGVPAANTRILVLDEHLQPVGPGVVGELYVGGAGLASGYLGDPTLTAERFIDDPVPPRRSAVSDGGPRATANGAIEFVGRNDDQIKMRGYRIHLNEIRHVLAQHPDVRDCVVRRLEDADGRSVLVAYYVANSLSIRDLRAFAHEHLVQAAVPSVFVGLQLLPLTVNGKVDLRALPGLDAVRQQSAYPDDQPRTDTERKLAEIWCRLLRFHRLGITESFFDLGGDSLMAVRLFLDGQDLFGVQLPTSACFPRERSNRSPKPSRRGSGLRAILRWFDSPPWQPSTALSVSRHRR